MAKSDSDSGSLWQDQPELPTQMVGLDRLQSKVKDFLKPKAPQKTLRIHCSPLIK
ncbi:MAG: hypothetical protein J07AB43_12640 [Candidatus Nanosalina sp. J07AB43]|nr:MAG: hypothetical protein J07AB43_12640 [Candidatus Nanosalina sp. J07AB43]